MSIKLDTNIPELIAIVGWFERLKCLHPNQISKADQEVYAKVNGKLSRVAAKQSADNSGENRPHRVKKQLAEYDVAAVPLPEEIKVILGRSKLTDRHMIRKAHQMLDGRIFSMDIGVDERTVIATLEAKARRVRDINWFKNPFEKSPTPCFKLIHPDDIRLGDFIWRPEQGNHHAIVGRVVTILHTPPTTFAAGFVTFRVDTSKKFGEAYGNNFMQGKIEALNVFTWQKEKNAIKIYKAF